MAPRFIPAQQNPANSVPFVINNSPTYFPKWRAARARVRAGAGTGRILCIGDSTTTGYGSNAGSSNNLKVNAYPAQLARLLTSAYSITAVENSFVGNFNATGLSGPGTVNGVDPRVTVGSSWSASVVSLGDRSYTATTSTNALTFLPTVNVDTFEIFYYTTGGLGTWSWALNGGAATNQTSNQATAVRKLTVTGTLTANTLSLKWVSGSAVYILGVNAYDSATKSVSVMNAGWVGGSSADMAPAVNAYDPAAAITGYAPDLTILSIGINDWNNNVSAAAYTANMQPIITSAASVGDVMLMTPPPTNPAATPVAQQTALISAMYALAQNNNCPLIDIYGRWGSYASANALGEYQDNYHPVAFGYADIVAAIASVLGGG